MPRPRSTIPKFCISRNGRAFTKVNGEFVSLGRGDNPDSRKRYAPVLTRLTTEKPAAVAEPSPAAGKPSITVNELLLEYFRRELPRFSSAEQACQRCAMLLAAELFGETLVIDFGPLKLRAVRDAMIAGDPHAKAATGKPKPRKPWSRETVNRQVKQLRAMFRWGVSWEMVPNSVVDALRTVGCLLPGETDAHESTPRLAVTKADIDAVRLQLRQRHRDVFDLLLLTGARPGELLSLTVGLIERTGEVWRCELVKHKTAHMGKRRVLFFNPAAQAILAKYITDDAGARLFNMRRDNFGHTVKRACIRAKVTPFVPHQLRHTIATKLADEMGMEAAQRLLGHSTAAMTEHYSRAAEKKAKEAVQKLG